ncbi:hypothetical protein SCHPADRAFT_911181 [Schizopora paradoxa]|uniref:Uncharacterized protein n=1 Tax=Schizopora paradoxa TaxID=27342 RepID=A0A0H2R090_9AGAM|nr:hypothetical protein SCHPADRAFT_911181 [Schizopora paradoxa]
MPNVQNVSLKLPEHDNLILGITWKEAGVLQHLRVLRLALPLSSPDEFSRWLATLEKFFADEYRKDFERLELQFRPYNSVTPKARLSNILGEKLRWIEC